MTRKKYLKSRGHRSRSKWYHRKRTVSAPTIKTEEVSWSTISQRFKRRKRFLLEKKTIHFGEEFTEIQAHLSKYPVNDEHFKMKLEEFVTAWKGALSYPHARMGTSSTGIPVAATSHCKQEATGWKRYAGRCLRCSSTASEEDVIDDLLNQESLDTYLKELEKNIKGQGAASSIMIREDMERMRLYDSASELEDEDVSYLATNKEEVETDLSVSFSEDDMAINDQFCLASPVHVELHHHHHHHHVKDDDDDNDDNLDLSHQSWEEKGPSHERTTSEEMEELRRDKDNNQPESLGGDRSGNYEIRLHRTSSVK